MCTEDGGKPVVKPIKYATPQGPTKQIRAKVGLGGDNYPRGGAGGAGFKKPMMTSGSAGMAKHRTQRKG